MDPGHGRVGLQRRRALTARHAGELCGEILPLLAGGRVRDVQALPPKGAVLAVETPGGLRRLMLSADPEAPRLHLVRERVRSHRGPLGPFFRRLVEELPGATIQGLMPLGGDRIVRLDLAAPSGERALVLELVGRHANLALLDGADRVLDVAALPPPPSDGEETPRLAPGQPWKAPPGRPPADAGGSLEQDFPLEEPCELGDAPLSRRVELTLGAHAAEARGASLASELVQRLKRRRKTVERTLAGLDARRRAAAGAERALQDGELLKSATGRVKRGQTSIELDDWFDAAGGKRSIELDPKLSPHENVERLFKRYRKLLKDGVAVEEDAARAEETLARLAALEAEALQPDADCEALDARAVESGLLALRQDGSPKKRAEPPPRLPYRRFEVQSGAEVLVGRSARDNDELSLKVARGSDLWLHTADAPGSHVVLRLQKGAEPEPEDVLDAAHLALHYSPLRGATRADIHVARCKEVKKPKGFPPGMVSLSGGRILHLRADPERLKRLLEARR